MPQIYLLDMSKDKDKLTSAYHFYVPDDLNVVGYSIRKAIVDYLKPEKSIVPYLNSSEQKKINSGRLVEIVHTVKFSAHLTNTEKINRAIGFGLDTAREKFREILGRLEVWGGYYEVNKN